MNPAWLRGFLATHTQVFAITKDHPYLPHFEAAGSLRTINCGLYIVGVDLESCKPELPKFYEEIASVPLQNSFGGNIISWRSIYPDSFVVIETFRLLAMGNALGLWDIAYPIHFGLQQNSDENILRGYLGIYNLRKPKLEIAKL